MQKKFEVLIICSLFVSSFFLARAGAAFVSAKSKENPSKCIVLDAGHGGSDPGKVGCNDTLEKDINLSIVYKLKTLFENKGFQVVLTRTDDKPLADEASKNMKIEDMRNRVALITQTMPVMTISIHQNSFPDASISGPQVFFYEQSAEGEAIAATLQNALNEKMDPPKPRASKSNDDYYILKKTPTPTVIVECGFLSNEKEAADLTTEAYQEKLARAIYYGTCEYLSSQSDPEAASDSGDISDSSAASDTGDTADSSEASNSQVPASTE